MLSYLFSKLWESEDARFKRILTERLTEQGMDTETLLAKVHETNSLIAGSYPLQILLKSKWADSDLDIFTSSPKMDQWLQQSLKPNILVSDPKSTYADDAFQTVTEYKNKQDFRIQVIYDPYIGSDIVNQVFERFDFDFCKVGYDG